MRKKQLFILLLISGAPVYGASFLETLRQRPVGPETNSFITFLNKWHDWSSRRWLHQDDRSLGDCLRERHIRGLRGESLTRSRGDFQTDEEYDEYVQRPRKDFPHLKLGPLVEGLGELADIVTLTSTSAKMIGWANGIALMSRLSDVALGSFPQLPGNGNQFSRLRFLTNFWLNNHAQLSKRSSQHAITHLVNQVGKGFDAGRAIDRIKNARLIAWYNKKYLSKNKKKRLRIMQVVHTLVLLASLALKVKLQYERSNAARHPWLIGESLVSFIRRLHMRVVQNRMLNDARDEKELERELATKSDEEA